MTLPLWPWRGGGPASLGAKLVLVLTAAAVAGALGITLLLATVITPSFSRLEQAAVDGQVERTAAMLADHAAKVEQVVRDYGDWTPSYDYMARPTGAFEQISLSPLAMGNLRVQGIAYVGTDRQPRAARWFDGTGEGEAAMRARLMALAGGTDWTRALGRRSSGNFYAALGPAVVAIGVAEVRRSDGSGPARGHVLMARRLDGAGVTQLLGQTAAIAPPRGAGLDIRRPNRAVTEIGVPILGPDKRPVAAVRFAVRRDVSLLGRRMLLLAVAGSTLLLLIVLVVLRRTIERQVLRPLHRVEAHMQRVRASGSLAPLAEDGRQDEIGALGRSFNAMLRQLGDLREQIEVQSFALGRSDSAVAVMHNVRNALNPVSTILSQGLAQAPVIDRAMLDRAVAELAGDAIPPARRRKLAAFVAAGTEAWAASRDAMRRELEIGREAMAHALEIIGQQQGQAHERPPLDLVDLTEIVARNAAIARYAAGASIALSFPATSYPAMANRMILSQVLGNLFGNAAEAIAARGGGSGSIAVAVAELGDMVELRIRDDGEGFDPATGAALFGRGFSTRSHKSGGLGLHWCANSMTAMDGSLRLESAGPGRGAVAVVTLRAAARAALAA